MAADDPTRIGACEDRANVTPEAIPDWLDLDGYRYNGRKRQTREHCKSKRKKTKKHVEWEVYVELTRLSSGCILCGNADCLQRLRIDVQGVRDQSIRGIPCMLRVNRPYYWCKVCNQHWSEVLPHLDPKRDITDRLRNQIWNDSFRKSHALIEIETGVDEGTIRAILKDGFEALDKTRQIELPEHLYFDEIQLSPKKRYRGFNPSIPLKKRMRAVCGDGGSRKPIELFEKCDTTLLENFFAQFTPEQLAGVKCISMDLSEFFDAVTKTCLPEKPRVADHYHVKKLINTHFDDAFRKQSIEKILSQAAAIVKQAKEQNISGPEELDKIQKAAEKDAKRIRKSRFTMMKKPDKRLDQDNQKIDALCLADETLRAALAEKDALFAIWNEAKDSRPEARKYEHKSAEDARGAYLNWVRDLSARTRPYWQGLMNSIETWSTEIFSFFDHPITNSPAETGNSIMRRQNRPGKDYGFPMIRGKALYRDVRGEDVPWAGEDKSDPTAASKARTFKAAKQRKQQAEARRLRRSEGSNMHAATLASPPAVPAPQLDSKPAEIPSPARPSCVSAPTDQSDEARFDVDQSRATEHSLEVPANLADPSGTATWYINLHSIPLRSGRSCGTPALDRRGHDSFLPSESSVIVLSFVASSGLWAHLRLSPIRHR